MTATIILRRDKTSPLTWEELDQNFINLRDAAGREGPPGPQGIPGVAGPAADASVSAVLTMDSIVLAADAAGVIPPNTYEIAQTTMNIILGMADDTQNWTFNKVDSLGVTSTIEGSTVSVTKMNDTSDVAKVTITASREGGYPDIVRVFSITKAKAGNTGAAGVAGPAADASVSAILTSEAYVFPASEDGDIAAADYAPAFTTMQVILGLEDDSVNWTFTKEDSIGIFSSITGNTVKVSNVSERATTGHITISASREGYPTLKRVFNIAKVRAGATGPEGEVGCPGQPGPQGAVGNAGQRGSRTFYVPVATNAWSDTPAYVAASVSAGPVLNDTVVQYNNDAPFSQTRFWTGASWALVNVALDGNSLVTGSVSADKLVNDAGVALVATSSEPVSYDVARQSEYPSIEEQLGAIWKVIASLPAKNVVPEARGILDRIKAVKATYEKDVMYVREDSAKSTNRYKKVGD